MREANESLCAQPHIYTERILPMMVPKCRHLTTAGGKPVMPAVAAGSHHTVLVANLQWEGPKAESSAKPRIQGTCASSKTCASHHRTTTRPTNSYPRLAARKKLRLRIKIIISHAGLLLLTAWANSAVSFLSDKQRDRHVLLCWYAAFTVAWLGTMREC